MWSKCSQINERVLDKPLVLLFVTRIKLRCDLFYRFFAGRSVHVHCCADIVPVKLEIKEFFDKDNTLYVAVALGKIKMTEVLKQGNTEVGVTQNSRSVNISISDLFKKINPSVCEVPSHDVIDTHIRRCGKDYRYQVAESPVKALRPRQCDNTTVGREKGAAKRRAVATCGHVRLSTLP